MTGRSCIQIALILLTATPATAQSTAGGAPEDQFKKACGTCHAAAPDAAPRQGPNLWGVYGRASGQVAGFKYSAALAGAKLTWDDATLDKWLTNPGAVVAGAAMPYRQRDPDKRAQIIAYLKTLGTRSP
jgi:cytochrome c